MPLADVEMTNSEMDEMLENAPAGIYTLELMGFREKDGEVILSFPKQTGGTARVLKPYYRIVDDPNPLQNGKSVNQSIFIGSRQMALFNKAFPGVIQGRSLDTNAAKGRKAKAKVKVTDYGNEVQGFVF